MQQNSRRIHNKCGSVFTSMSNNFDADIKLSGVITVMLEGGGEVETINFSVLFDFPIDVFRDSEEGV